jgi:cell division protease FtsH
MNKALRSPRGFILLAVIVLAISAFMATRSSTPVNKLSLGVFETKLANGGIATAKLGDRTHQVTGKLADGTKYRLAFPDRYGDTLTAKILAARGSGATGSVAFETDAEPTSTLTLLLYNFLPTLLILGVLVWFLVKGPAGKGVMQLTKSKAKRFVVGGPTVTFADVAGIDEAVDELTEIREFLKEPARFNAVGARIPRGILLSGPPGTGKTLLARAVAGEAGVPFFSISGSDFVEMFVGVGSARVRDLFTQAKAVAPAIIFVDEIDAVGRQRGQGITGANDEREQTLNQLLVEMDGFENNTGVIVMAGTNRVDILDRALLRPGRFDRQITLDKPDLRARKAILAVHAKGKPLAPGIDLDMIAKRTPGFTGADLANVLNEAAIFAARRNDTSITSVDVDGAIDRVLMGPERKGRLLSEDERRITAYHEAGHALVGLTTNSGDPIHKVSIISRGQALGVTISLPEAERFTHRRSELLDRLAMLFGGLCAEVLIFGEPTTGAQNDIEQATRIARLMVTQFGMSDKVGLVQVGQTDPEFGAPREHSEATAEMVDSEVRSLLQLARERATEILTTRRETLTTVANALLERETLTGEEVTELCDPKERAETA